MDNAKPLTDSAGVPWAGRTITASPFADDDGTAAPEVTAALADYHQDPTAATLNTVGQAVLAHRVLVPLLALEKESGPTQQSPTGVDIAADKMANVALVSIYAPDGRQALPVFSHVAAMQQWSAQARPIPANSRQAFLSAVEEGCQVVCLDPGSPSAVTFPRPAVWAWAQGRDWVPFLADEAARKTLRAECVAIDEIEQIALHPGQNAEVELTVGVRAGLTADQLQRVNQELQQTLAGSTIVADRIDSLAIRLIPIN